MGEPRADAVLPDFCASGRVVDVLVICGLTALLLALAAATGSDAFWGRLFVIAVFVQWIGVFSAAALCLIRRHAGHYRGRVVAAGCYAALLAVTLGISEIAYVAAPYTGIAGLVSDTTHAEFLLRNLAVGALVAALGLRYFWLREGWRRQAGAEAEARYQALQARIRPHFLFNCLNSIAALAADRPAAAEQAIEDLAEILRASLADAGAPLVTLAQELAVTQAYTRIESLRLGERLAFEWDVAPAALDWPLPVLAVQPLVENAVRHGIERLPGGGTVSVRIRAAGGRLEVRVTNPAPVDAETGTGLHLALANIRERLALRYGAQASLHTKIQKDRFSVHLDLPGQATMGRP